MIRDIRKDIIVRMKFYLIFILIFTFNVLLAAPTVTNVSPFIGPTSGGTTVTITGTGFTDGSPVQVFFDRISASSFSVLSDTTITAISPSHTPQTVFVTVIVGTAMSSLTPNSQYLYQGNYQAYISNSNSGTVSVIDITNDAVSSTLTVGNNPCSIAITPDGTKAYVANITDNSVSVIDIASNTVVANPSVGLFPDAIVIKPDGTEAYVVNNNSGTVSVINIPSDIVNPTIMNVGSNPCTVAIKPDGSKVYITASTSCSVSVIDATGHTVIANLPVGVNPDAVVIRPDGAKVYVVNDNSGQVSVIDTATDTVSPTPITVGNNPCAIAITPDGSKAYVANATSNNVSIINTTSDSVTSTASVGVFPKAIAIRPDGAKAYVVNDNSGQVSVINTATDTVSSTLTVGNNPFAIAITPDGLKAYVVNATDNNVSVINTLSDSVVATPVVGVFPFAIAITPDQAPLASFTFLTAPAGQPSTFDASASASPVGSIVDYFWDFGDGQTLDAGQQMMVQHIYAVPGTYSVSLTVTNSAGTSTEQIYDHSSSHDFNFLNLPITRNETITHNGGPSATRTQSITILPPTPLPPTNLKVHQVENIFATQTDLINILTWEAPKTGPTPVEYRIYRDQNLTKLAAVIPANKKLEFKDHNRKKGHIYKYFVVTVDVLGNISVPAVIVVE
jgi:YVTN family beta-propeller protein